MRNLFMRVGQSVLLGLLLFLFACNNPNTKTPLPIDPNPPAAQVPAVPGGFASSNLTTRAVTLSWEVAAGAQDYTLERGEGAAPSSWTALTLSAPAALTYSDTTLTPSTTYSYRLRANNTVGSSDWATLNLTTPALPPNAPVVPSNFASSNLTSSSVRLSWEAVVGATRYALERGLGNSPSTWTALTLSSPNATQFDDTGLTPQTTYSYRLRSGNADGDSPWVVLGLSTLSAALPAAPANFASSNLTAGGVRLTWDAVAGATRYALERGLGSSPTTWEALTLTSLMATQFDDGTLEPQTSYRYRLRSSNTAGDSGWVFVGVTTPAAPAVNWRVEPWASGLRDPNNASSPDVVWSMRFTPDNTRMLYTPRDRTTIEVRSIDVATKQVTTILGTAPVRDENFAGILGMTLDPNFATNRHLYICYSLFVNGARRNRVSRFTLGSALTDERPMLNLAGGFTQNGCRVVVGPDGKLYASMGYTGDFSIAQDINQPGGKILRINLDGTIPTDNPFYGQTTGDARAIWTFGHRNPQGIAFRPGNSQLWSTEHGENTRDELNLIIRGQNYGWPLCVGTQAYGVTLFVPNEPEAIRNFVCTGRNLSATNYQPAIRQYEQDGSSSIAPSNLIFYTGRTFLGWRNNLFFLTLRTGRMYRLVLDGDRIAREEILITNNQYGRLRDIMVGPEGYIYFSNDSGSIYRIVPQ
jgi:aldose sugar dehydrogenase